MNDIVDLFGHVNPQAGMVRQLPLPLGWRGRGLTPALLVGPANGSALSILENYADWRGSIAVLYGPPRSGKSMLARHFLGLCPTAQIADPADNIDETELFHACIRATESGLPLLMLVTGEPGDWVPELPDLATRVAAAQQMVINAPDMDMIEALLIRRLDELNVSITPDALTYVLTRAERSFLWVDRLCTVLANEQHGRGYSVNLRTVREMLLLDKQTGPHEFSISTV